MTASRSVRLLIPVAVLLLAGCQPPPVTEQPAVSPPAGPPALRETPAPDGVFREHRLSRCREDADVPAAVESYLGLASEYFRDGSGSDGMIELELGLGTGNRHPLMLVTLGQLYLLAGQGNPDLLPNEGPAADLGSYDRNKPRLLGRAQVLLEEALRGLPDDAVVDYLLADVARAMGNRARADSLVSAGHGKCTGGRTFRILQMYQELYQHPPRYLGGPSPEFPDAAVRKGLGGDVVLDLLLGPGGEVRQYVVVESPGRVLTDAAWASLRKGRFDAARIGKYGVWSWLRVTTAFNLAP